MSKHNRNSQDTHLFDIIRTRRALNVDDEVSTYRKKAGWFDDDTRMKAYNNGAFSTTSQSTFKNREFWMGLVSTLLAFIAAVIVMFGFFYYLKHFLSPDDDRTNLEDSYLSHRRRSRSRSRRRRASRSKSYHRRKVPDTEQSGYSDPISITQAYPDASVDPIPTSEYTLFDSITETQVGMISSPVISPVQKDNEIAINVEALSPVSIAKDTMHTNWK